MSAASLTARAQRAARALMVDTCTVRYLTGRMVQDESTGAEAPVYADRFTSPCRVQARQLVARTDEAGGRSVVSMRLELHLPVGMSCEAGDIAEITAAGAGSATEVGRRLRVSGPVDKTFPSSFRYEVTEIVA